MSLYMTQTQPEHEFPPYVIVPWKNITKTYIETSMHNLRIVAHIDSGAVAASSFLFSWPKEMRRVL